MVTVLTLMPFQTCNTGSLGQRKGNTKQSLDNDGLPMHLSWPKAPFPKGIDQRLIEKTVGALDDAYIFHFALGTNQGVYHDHPSQIPGDDIRRKLWTLLGYRKRGHR